MLLSVIDKDTIALLSVIDKDTLALLSKFARGLFNTTALLNTDPCVRDAAANAPQRHVRSLF